MVVVDSSVWVHYLRTPNSPVGQEMNRLLEADEVSITGVVLAEVLQGARNETDFERLRSSLETLPYIDQSPQTWLAAARIGMRLRVEGRLIPLTDLAIAATALEADEEVYTLDEHFERVPGLRLHRAEGDCRSGLGSL